MILKVDAIASLTVLFLFLLLSYPLLLNTYDLSGLERLRDGCSITFETVKNMPFTIRPKGDLTVVELYVSGTALDTIHVNGTVRWLVKVGCGG